MSKIVVDERFDGETFNSTLEWFNPPQDWQIDRSRRCLIVEPQPNTDFWQRTHYGFQADTGHLLKTTIAGDFCMATEVHSHPVHQYDQAGLFVRASPECWVKTSIEHEPDGCSKLGAVVTSFGYSDWSFQEYSPRKNAVRLQIRKQDGDLTVEFAEVGETNWQLVRVAHLHCDRDQALDCGLYACSPKGGGFSAEFFGLRIVLATS